MRMSRRKFLKKLKMGVEYDEVELYKLTEGKIDVEQLVKEGYLHKIEYIKNGKKRNYYEISHKGEEYSSHWFIFRNYIIPIFATIAFIFTVITFFFGNPQKIIHDIIYPPISNFTLIPNFLPEENEIKMEILNNGDKTLSEFFIDYQFFCTMNASKRTSLQKQVLKPDESSIFQIKPPGLNFSCSVASAKLVTRIYRDKNRICYVEFIGGKGNTCQFCRSHINITSLEFETGKKINKNFEIWFPFFDLELIYYGESKSCLPINKVSNKSSLTLINEFSSVVFDPSTYCLRGDEPDWCRQVNITDVTPRVKEIK